MTPKHLALVIFILVFALASGCSRFPGKPSEADKWIASSEVLNFDQLYGQNCAGCHGSAGRFGAARSLNDPLFLNLITPADLEQVIREGVPSTSMPAFAQKFGGQLTDAQIDVLAEQMRSQWGNPEGFNATSLPAYRQQDNIANGAGVGDSQRGATAYNSYCSGCHGMDGRGGKTAGSIIDPNFLKLVSDQSLRTTVIAGRRYIGEIDCRATTNGQPMSAQEVSDLVAWLVAQRPWALGSERAQPASQSSSEIKTAIAR
ncbi:MAG TPA: c-type cytochrome [Blastocatellia bacterium]|nr:c-type cytochrome [Blastocatellia bacterium]